MGKSNKYRHKFFGENDDESRTPNKKENIFSNDIPRRARIRQKIENELTRSELKQVKDYYHA